MSRQYQINKTADGWQFANEAVLEDFVWDNLEDLIGWKPLRRQHHVDGNYCDILAIGKNRQLVVIELKNAEDRYVIQQLTRYYHALLQKKPYEEQIDYKLRIVLTVISPIFHKNNLVDRQYHNLKFDLFKFSIIGNSEPRFRLQKLESTCIYELDIPYYLEPNENETRQIPPVPKSLNTALSRCSKHNPNIILSIREKILNFDERIQEVKVDSGHFIFGKGKTKPCAEFMKREEKLPNNSLSYPLFALWLPISFRSSNAKDRISRVTLPTILFLSDEASWQYRYGVHVNLCQRGERSTRESTKEWDIEQYIWLFLQKELNKQIDRDNLSKSLQEYCDHTNLPNPYESNLKCLDFFVEIALQRWKQRL